MSADQMQEPQVQLDLSDVEWRVGHVVGSGQLWEACSATDIRRWVQAMDYPNPIHWDEEFARNSKFGGIVAPQSFTVAMDYGHGCHPACVGKIPGTHLIFAGEEWWFYGTPIRPGDKLFQERRFDGYKVTDTRFAGPTMFCARRYGPSQPARRADRQGARDRDPLSRRGGEQARRLRQGKRGPKQLDRRGAGGDQPAAARMDPVEPRRHLAAL